MQVVPDQPLVVIVLLLPVLQHALDVYVRVAVELTHLLLEVVCLHNLRRFALVLYYVQRGRIRQ